MRRPRQPVQFACSPLRLAIRDAFARPFLTGSLLLALAPAGQSLTLGNIHVRSSLGQRLDARVPVRLGAGEALASKCVVPSHEASDLRSISAIEVKTPQASREGVYDLQITSAAPLYEPMYELELKVQCPGSPVLIRQYVLMLDLPGAVASSAALNPEAAPVPVRPISTPAAAAQIDPSPAPPSVERDPMRHLAGASRPGETIEAGAHYRVVAGDSLSSIAARVHSRKVSLWALARAIQAANPDAFIRGDANLIKLGSEILIPVTTTTASPPVSVKAAPEPLPSPVVAPVVGPVPAVPTPEPAPVTPPVLATVAPSQTELPQATQPVVNRPRARPAPLTSHATGPKPTAKVPDDAAANETNPVVAASAGILFGLCISALLWLRGRLPSRQRSAGAGTLTTRRDAPAALAAAVHPGKPAPAPLVTRTVEPAFSVSYTPPAEDTVETEFAGEDITSELEDLFASTDTTMQKRLNAEKLLPAGSRGTAPGNEPAPTLDTPVRTADFPVGEPTVEAVTAQSPTAELRSFSTSATREQQQAQTLLESLTLLERDYEEELTASQVLDMSAVRAALDEDLDEPTQLRDAQIRAASASKKSR